jgi:low affinity Fe/Cu permease
VPPDHVPPLAPPPNPPASCTCGVLAHTIASRPAFTVAAGLMVIFIASLTAPHGPAGSLVVKVSVTVPAVTSAALGV